MNRQQRVESLSRSQDNGPMYHLYENTSKANLQAQKPRDIKICDSLATVIRRSGLQDGMTISFHHAFRAGDLTLNLVMDTIAAMGFKNLQPGLQLAERLPFAAGGSYSQWRGQ